MSMNIQFNLEKIKRYDKAGPRYTSYPTAVSFTPEFTEHNYRKHAIKSNSADNIAPLSLYFHIPFCDTVCFYCACNKIATKDYSKAETYLQYLYREIDIQTELFDDSRVVEQLHWGGGTPTFLNHQQIKSLMAYTRQSFRLLNNDRGDYSIEIDPRSVSTQTIEILREAGFNRFSLGVQDINATVQKAVNRIQPIEQTCEVIEACRNNQAKSISVDLIYGLPFQTVHSFTETLQQIIEISPDRISLFNYAHLPHLFKPQRRINEQDLPKAEEKLEILQLSVISLIKAGYVYIGMDHFAKPDDELAIAQHKGKLHRNFQGYTTHADCDLIAMGVSAISAVNNCYSQNNKTLDGYYRALEEGKLPVVRGLSLTCEDVIRRAIIQQLSCHFSLDYDDIETRYSIDFKSHFARELDELKQLEGDDLLSIYPNRIDVSSKGRYLIRIVCMIFDQQLANQTVTQQFSKVI